MLFRLKQKFYRIMYNLCFSHLQSFNSVQQKLFVLQPLKDMFQNRSLTEPQVQSGVATALTRPEATPDFTLWCYLKDRVYGHNPQTIPDLKAAITIAIRPIPREEEGTLPGESKSACNGGGRIWIHISLNFCRTNSFCCTELILCRCWLHRLNIIQQNFCLKLNNILGVIRRLLVS